MATAQYAIDVAANMSGGDQTNARLDALTVTLSASGKGADFFSEALTKVSDELTSAKAASVAANDALAEGEAQYATLERAALQASKAEEKAALAGKLDPTLSRTVHEATAALEAHAQKLRVLERDAEQADAAEKKLGQTFDNLKKLSGHVDKSFAAQAESLGKVQGALGTVGGPVGALGQQLLGPIKGFKELSGTMGSTNAAALLGAAGLAVFAAAVVAVTIAVVAGTIAIAAWAVGLADSARAAGLSREAAEAFDGTLIPLRGTIEALTGETGQSSEKLRGLVKTLNDAKVSAEDMPAALRAAALAETALGQGGSAEFVAQIKAGKVAVSELSADVQNKLGGIVAKQMLGLDAQSAKLKKNIGDIFGGLNIDPVLEGMRILTDLFDKNTAAGQAMKFLFESVFQPLIDQATNAAYVIEAFALGFLIGMTKVYIAVKPAIKAVSEFFGFEDTSLTDSLDLAKKAGELIVPVFLVFAGVIGAVVAVVGLAVAQVVAIQVALWGLIAAVIAAGVAVVSGIIDAWTAVTTFLSEIDLEETGRNILQGLADGITGAAGSVISAITGAVGDGITAAKNLLGIASPSKVFAEIGDNTGAGLVQGVEGMTGDVQDAFSAMVEPPDVPVSSLAAQDIGGSGTLFTGAATPAGAAAGTQAPAKAAKSVPSSVTINQYGIKDAADAIAQMSEALTLLLEGDAAEAGAEAAPA